MNKEKQEKLSDLLKDIDELYKEIRNLKYINSYLYNAIKYIEEKASEICSTFERKGIVDTCNYALVTADRIAQRLGIKIDE